MFGSIIKGQMERSPERRRLTPFQERVKTLALAFFEDSANLIQLPGLSGDVGPVVNGWKMAEWIEDQLEQRNNKPRYGAVGKALSKLVSVPGFPVREVDSLPLTGSDDALIYGLSSDYNPQPVS